MNGTTAGAIGGAVTIVANYVFSVLWQILSSHGWMPAITPPSPEFLGAEQLLVTIWFSWWATKEKLTLPGDAPAPPAPQQQGAH